MSDDRHWSDPRWADPDTRAHVDQPASGWPAPATDVPPPPAAAARRPLTPWLAGLIGLVVGAAVAVPVGLANRPSSAAAPSQAAAPAPNSPATRGPAPADDVPAKVDPSIVDITSRLGYQRAVAAGTGMVLTADGDVLTNNHVIEGATSITATSVTTGQQYSATVVGTDPTQDVAVIHLARATGLAPITTDSTSHVTIGDAVVALGNAGGAGGTPAVATGYVTGLDQQITATDSNGRNPQHLTGLIETDAAIRPGDSGGPLADTHARVIGMDTAASVSGGLGGGATTGRGFAIPIAHALAIAHLIQTGQASSTVHIGPRGMIGVQVADVSTGTGATVESVTAGSPAARVGIKAGDTITAIDGQPVTTSSTLGTLVKAHGAGDRVGVTWTASDGSTHTATVTLAAGPPD